LQSRTERPLRPRRQGEAERRFRADAITEAREGKRLADQTSPQPGRESGHGEGRIQLQSDLRTLGDDFFFEAERTASVTSEAGPLVRAVNPDDPGEVDCGGRGQRGPGFHSETVAGVAEISDWSRRTETSLQGNLY